MQRARILARNIAPFRRLSAMSSHLSNGQPNGNSQNSHSPRTYSLEEIPKTNNFTSKLPPDPAYPTPLASHSAPRSDLGPRLVKNALYTYVRPDPPSKSELLSVSPAALHDLSLDSTSTQTETFKAAVSGSSLLTFDPASPPAPSDAPEQDQRTSTIYPWAQCYGGFQFGQWAGQLGDGRAISLFEIPAVVTPSGRRYELQLKGAGRTPYSRFADGKAVLRSSIREYIVSEALNALGIPSTRALSLTLCPEANVRRERVEPGAIVARFAETWVRLGTFDLMRSRGDRGLIRRLSDYVAEDVFGGWETLPGKVKEGQAAEEVERGVAKDTLQGEGKEEENRYVRLYREIARRNAKTVAAWQAYAFTNGVLNTDNTSVYGLSVDFGPFAFLDNFDPNYTPNHDDHMLRYSYKNQPSIIWWNLLRLGEAMGELIGSGSRCDEEQFVNEGVSKDCADELVSRAENIIENVGDEYRSVFMTEYKRLMTARLGLKKFKEADFEVLYSELLDTLEALELDFHHTFRKLSNVAIADLDTEEKRKAFAPTFFHHEGLSATAIPSEEDAIKRIANWLEKWRARVVEDWSDGEDSERQAAMKKVNPKFVPRSWILDELIDRVEKKGEREILDQVMNMALHPFEEGWGGNKDEEERFCGDVPKYNRAMQCSCSS